MSSDLVPFLRLRLDEDETAARAVIGGRPMEHMRYLTWFQTSEVIGDRNGDVVAYGVKPWAVGHIVRQDPAQVLREVEAKRQIVDDCAEYDRRDEHAVTDGLSSRTLCWLALPYAHHPDYDQDWRPTPEEW